MQVVGDATWPAIVDRDIFERVTAIVESRGAHLVGRTHAQAPLTSVMVCGKCGNTLRQAQANRKRAWKCGQLPAGGGGCGGVLVKAEPLEARIYEVVFRYVDTVKLAQLVDAGEDDVRARVVDQLAALERRADEYLDMLASGELTRADYGKVRQSLLIEQAALTNKLARSERHTVLAPYLGKPGRLEKAWPDLSVDRKRAVIVAALAPITVYGAARKGPGFDVNRVRFGELNQRAEELLAS
jgi:hypothetical protein